MAINERLIDTEVAAAGNGGAEAEQGLILHLDANDVDSYDGDGTEWVDIKDHEYTPTTNVSEHFNTVLYTGTGATNFITGVGFQPDLIWIKDRTAIEHHYIMDSVRGKNGGIVFENLYSSLTNAQANDNSLTSLDEDGFTLQATGNGNVSGESNVAWCFKAGGAAVSNTDGTITSQVSANNDLGFSIVKWTGNDTTGATIGHGMSSTPELTIIKNTGSSSDWQINLNASVTGTEGYMNFNTAGLYTTFPTYYTSSNSTVLSSNGTSNATRLYNNQSSDYIAYCFASKRGVSKVGSYTGTGATNKVYTGFEPAFIIGKCSSDNVTNWWIFDNKREDKVLYPNLFNSEDTLSDYVSFDRDGFTLSNAAFVNQSGRTFIYYAVAKNTNEISLIPDTDLEIHLDADSFPQKNEAGYSNTPSTWTALTGSNGTITGATFDSELGNYLDFDGVNDYVSVPNISFAYQSGFTYELWFRAHTNTQGYVCRPTGSSGLPALSWRLYGGWGVTAFHYTGTGAGVTYLDSDLDVNKWYHAVYTADSNGGELYIDGELADSTSTSVRSGACSGNFYIANYNTASGNNFDGDIGQFRIYYSKLTQDQIRQNYNFTKPSYPNGYDGAITGATWNAGGYFDFDGIDDVVETQLLTKADTVRSYSFWFRTSYTGAQVIFDGNNASSTSAWHHLYIDSTKMSLRLSGSAGTQSADDTTNYCDNVWRHCVAVCNTPNFKKIYINGTETASNTSFSTSSGSLVGLDIGHYQNTGTLHFNGDISTFKAYDKVLTQAEITALYNEGQ